MPVKITVGISGASGVIYGIRLLETLRELGIEISKLKTFTRWLMLSIAPMILPPRFPVDHSHPWA
jgi:3-polyprenyl-4-hydroxybenzoate decarboxylase